MAALVDLEPGGTPRPAPLTDFPTCRPDLEASGEPVDTSYEPLRDLIRDIATLRLDSYQIADRLRSWKRP
ncbi:hypothetical protein [Streptomyces sp. NPDC029704]|uniref:hypothetical protein n=1 Tax=Streptomyces sp. NPDC029704 TaxID=3156920 RepID=UPI00340926B3